MNNGRELIEALNQIEKEKGISKDILLEAMENSLVAACKNEYGKADNIRILIVKPAMWLFMRKKRWLKRLRTMFLKSALPMPV